MPLRAGASKRWPAISSLSGDHETAEDEAFLKMILGLSLPELNIHGPLPAMPTLSPPYYTIVSIVTGLAPLDLFVLRLLSSRKCHSKCSLMLASLR